MRFQTNIFYKMSDIKERVTVGKEELVRRFYDVHRKTLNFLRSVRKYLNSEIKYNCSVAQYFNKETM